MRYYIQRLRTKTITAIISVILAVTFLISNAASVLAKTQTNKHSSDSKRHLIHSSANDSFASVIEPSEEVLMLKLINQERAKAGLTQFEIDPVLTEIAQAKSWDMVSQNYFGHLSERFGTIYDQLQKNGVFYRCAAENLAAGSNLGKIQRKLLQSSAHRSNILNPKFTKIGIGIAKGSPYGKMVTEIFID